MKTIEEIKALLDDAGIIYQSNTDESGSNKFLTTLWKLKNQIDIKILIFLNSNKDWVNLTSKIGELNEFKGSVDINQILLHLNLNVIGPKFCMDSKYNIYCNAEVFYDSSNSESLKRMLVQIVNAISLFNQETIKKQN